jgi:hypothetical protein
VILYNYGARRLSRQPLITPGDQGQPEARAPVPRSDDPFAPVLERLEVLAAQLTAEMTKINNKLDALSNARMIKDFYTTGEAAALLGKAEFTVREWCRNGRVHAEKRACGRGCSKEWTIAHAELQRIQNEGLLPRAKD